MESSRSYGLGSRALLTGGSPVLPPTWKCSVCTPGKLYTHLQPRVGRLPPLKKEQERSVGWRKNIFHLWGCGDVGGRNTLPCRTSRCPFTVCAPCWASTQAQGTTRQPLGWRAETEGSWFCLWLNVALTLVKAPPPSTVSSGDFLQLTPGLF